MAYSGDALSLSWKGVDVEAAGQADDDSEHLVACRGRIEEGLQFTVVGPKAAVGFLFNALAASPLVRDEGFSPPPTEPGAEHAAALVVRRCWTRLLPTRLDRAIRVPWYDPAVAGRPRRAMGVYEAVLPDGRLATLLELDAALAEEVMRSS